MESPLTTKKFLAALTKDGGASPRSSFVIPAMDGSPWFVDLRSGKRHDTAYLVFIGKPITADDVLGKLSDIETSDRVRRLIESMFVELQRFKIGNVVAVQDSNGEVLQLRLVDNAPSLRTDP